eukprot:GHVR01050748.1.p1 GENE.GHVR01050748.1~~GHVR01050748.1.p1  ORF type:complete len:146 (+),score=50.22 GHVR01050748.1:99-536(+)
MSSLSADELRNSYILKNNNNIYKNNNNIYTLKNNNNNNINNNNIYNNTNKSHNRSNSNNRNINGKKNINGNNIENTLVYARFRPLSTEDADKGHTIAWKILSTQRIHLIPSIAMNDESLIDRPERNFNIAAVNRISPNRRVINIY